MIRQGLCCKFQDEPIRFLYFFGIEFENGRKVEEEKKLVMGST